jgi:hypothetical protein
VRLAANGNVAFSVTVRRQPDDTLVEFVTLYYSPKDRVIAFRFTKQREPNSYRLQGSGGIVGRGFFRHYGIDTERYAGRYTLTRHRSADLGIDHEGDSFVLKLRRAKKSVHAHAGSG